MFKQASTKRFAEALHIIATRPMCNLDTPTPDNSDTFVSSPQNGCFPADGSAGVARQSRPISLSSAALRQAIAERHGRDGCHQFGHGFAGGGRLADIALPWHEFIEGKGSRGQHVEIGCHGRFPFVGFSGW